MDADNGLAGELLGVSVLLLSRLGRLKAETTAHRVTGCLVGVCVAGLIPGFLKGAPIVKTAIL
jgi:hypothetical protein